ncbi:hypothetical protein GOODEAATRI_018774 [Goodea atripinnis]|uniref:Myb-like, SWIRM and MPN domain-containing protein 1 n=1 Tax=Goodea atripinnis TaxID=208336 RepID=A0ABV0PZ66_9TELE
MSLHWPRQSCLWPLLLTESMCLFGTKFFFLLFEAQYGRRWTKIAKLVDSRSVLQVKSYARQYFKHKHAHVSRGEVIGLLGGMFDQEEKVLKVGGDLGLSILLIIPKADKQFCVQICAAEPCNSVSTGLQCEMDPVSQTQACDVLLSLGFSVVGWYHSHPSFHPNPSVRDIDTQDQFQVKRNNKRTCADFSSIPYQNISNTCTIFCYVTMTNVF